MNSFPRHLPSSSSVSLAEAAALVGADPPDVDLELTGIRPLGDAGPGDLGLLAHRRYLMELEGSRAGALLVSGELAGEAGRDGRPCLVVEDAHQALATLLERFFPREGLDPEIHPTAVLGRGVRLGDGVRIGPYSVLEEGVEVGDGSRIGAHVVVGADSRLGRGVLLHPQVVVYPGAVLGDGVILHAGARVGVDGFGYVFQEGRHRKVPQVGGCVIGEDVEIGANTTVDRGSIGDTRIGPGCKLDNLVQIGHNVTVGPLSILAGQAGVAGSARVGAGVLIGGQAGIGGHLELGDRSRISAQAGVTGDIGPGETVTGYPARPRMEFLRAVAAQARMPELRKRIKELEGRLEALEGASEGDGI
jgi:UDP-3-O-[3-hydroxymyristoyl] glucosamine N-acyltransferase